MKRQSDGRPVPGCGKCVRVMGIIARCKEHRSLDFETGTHSNWSAELLKPSGVK